jgi:hypothetical protein
MERRRNEARRAVYQAIGCAREKVDKSLLVGWVDGEDIYQRDHSASLARQDLPYDAGYKSSGQLASP